MEIRIVDTMEEGEGGMNSESSNETYTIIICKTNSYWEVV